MRTLQPTLSGSGKVKQDRVERLAMVLVGADMRVRTRHTAHHPSVLKRITLHLIRLDPIQRQGGIKARRLITYTLGRVPPRAPRTYRIFMRLPCCLS